MEERLLIILLALCLSVYIYIHSSELTHYIGYWIVGGFILFLGSCAGCRSTELPLTLTVNVVIFHVSACALNKRNNHDKTFVCMCV